MIEISRSAILKCLGVSALALGLTSCSGNSVTGPPPPTLASLTGNYVFSVTGTDPTDGDYFVLGSFVADGKGNITSAVADYNLGSGIDANVPLTGTYTVSGEVATIKLTDGGETQDSFVTSLVTSGTAAIQSFDGDGSGVLYAQTTSGFSPMGNFAYTVKGEGQGTVTGSGQLVVGAGGTFSSGTLSYMDAQTLATYPTITGFLYTPENGGRGQASLEGNNLAYYVVSPSQVLMIGLDERALLLITALKQ
jgi:hypothetical protein